MSKRASYYQWPDGTVIARDGTYTPRDAVKMKRAEGEQAYKEQARAKLRELLKPGRTVYTVLNHVSSSGMSRRISLCIGAGEEVQDVTGWAAQAMGEKVHDKGGIVVGGCGMDMGFDLVYRLGRVLYPQGFDLPAGARGRNGDTSGHDNDGGYALNHKWL